MAERILITGGTGFAGSHLLEHLIREGERDLHVTTYSAPDQLIQDWLDNDHIHQLNLLDRAATGRLIAELQPTQIYHLAAMAEVGSSFAQAEQTVVNNTVLQLNLLEAVRDYCPATRILVVGSGQEYDVLYSGVDTTSIPETAPLGPVNPYGVSKVTQDLLGLAYFYSYHLPVLRVRPFNHIGERQTAQFAVASFAQQIAKIERGQQSELLVGNLAAERDFTDVKDMVKAYHLVMSVGTPGEVYNIGTGHPQSMQSILDTLISFARVPIRVSIDEQRFRPIDIPTIGADSSKIRQLGWQPSIPLEQTLERVLAYWRDHTDIV